MGPLTIKFDRVTWPFLSEVVVAIICDMSETLMLCLDRIPNFKVLCKDILKLFSL